MRIFETKLYNFFLSEEESGYNTQTDPDFDEIGVSENICEGKQILEVIV